MHLQAPALQADCLHIYSEASISSDSVHWSAASYTATLASFLVSNSPVSSVIDDYSAIQVHPLRKMTYECIVLILKLCSVWQRWNSTVVGWTKELCMLQAMSGLVLINGVCERV